MKQTVTLSWHQAQELLPFAKQQLADAKEQQKRADAEGRKEWYCEDDWQEIVDALNGQGQ